MTALWRPGRRLLTVASVLMLLTATAHTLGFLAPPTTDADRAVLDAMAGLKTPMGLGMSPSVLDIFLGLAFTLGLTLAALGAFGLLVAGSPESSPSLVRKAAWLSAVWVAGFLALNLHYRVPPPILSAIAIEIPLVVMLARPQHREG